MGIKKKNIIFIFGTLNIWKKMESELKEEISYQYNEEPCIKNVLTVEPCTKTNATKLYLQSK